MPFETTHWSLVIAAGGDSERARHALSQLCEAYWYPLYAFVRRQTSNPDDARDLTQGFIASLIERRDFANLRQDRGRFRSFLLTSMQHFLSNDIAKKQALKRGGGILHLSLELENAEGRYLREPVDTATPQTLYERRWAVTVIERVLATLRKEWEDAGRGQEFLELKACLQGETPDGGYAAVALRVGSTEGAVRTAVHRLRRRFQKVLRQEILETVTADSEVDEEIRYLFQALNS